MVSRTSNTGDEAKAVAARAKISGLLRKAEDDAESLLRDFAIAAVQTFSNLSVRKSIHLGVLDSRLKLVIDATSVSKTDDTHDQRAVRSVTEGSRAPLPCPHQNMAL
jgi:hypothetical protein